MEICLSVWRLVILLRATAMMVFMPACQGKSMLSWRRTYHFHDAGLAADSYKYHREA